jgi:hypothetical protein
MAQVAAVAPIGLTASTRVLSADEADRPEAVVPELVAVYARL